MIANVRISKTEHKQDTNCWAQCLTYQKEFIVVVAVDAITA
eukprot:COSAG03_NODE_9891_length_687_cov_5.417303_2_plen_40_part_01